MKEIYFILLAVLLPLIGFSQANIKGQIIDQESQKPLSFASIAVPNTTTGTMSNDVGDFQLLLKEGQTEIQISYIGYIDTLIIIDPEVASYQISLKPYEFELAEVIVRSLSPLEYIKKALEKHPTLTPTQPFETTAFFATKSSLVNDSNGSYKLEEAVFNTYNSDFANDTLGEDSQLLLYREETIGEFTSILEENRRLKKMDAKFNGKEVGKKENEEDQEKEVEEKSEGGNSLSIGAGKGGNSLEININDLVGSGPEAAIKEAKSITDTDFFDSAYFKKFNYTFGEQTFFQGRELIKIDFSNKRKVEGAIYKGSVYLDYEDLAIVAVDYNEKWKIPFLINALLKTIVGFTLDGIDRDIRIRNQFVFGTWYPKDVVLDLKVTLKQKKRYETIATAQVLNIEDILNENPTPIAEGDVFDKDIEYIEQIRPIEGVTWDKINVVKF